MKKGLRVLALLVCASVALYFGGLLARYLVGSYEERQANFRLAEQRKKAVEAVLPGVPGKYTESGMLYQYEGLWQKNRDMFGWLSIEGTKIDYPVMYTPEDIEYYIHRGFDGGYAASGCLFIGEGWSETAGQTIVYGHHMKDGSMFTDLERYKDADFAREHAVIRFDTLTEERSYEVVAAFYGRVYTEGDQDVFRYYQYTDLSDPAVFEEFTDWVGRSALYDTGCAVRYGDELLTLSTCSEHTAEGRFVVVAKRQPTTEE